MKNKRTCNSCVYHKACVANLNIIECTFIVPAAFEPEDRFLHIGHGETCNTYEQADEVMFGAGLISKMIAMHRVHSIDERGYYIANSDGGARGGIYYLYHDGIIRCGVNSKWDVLDKPSSAFWSTEAEAWAFYYNWAGKNGHENG